MHFVGVDLAWGVRRPTGVAVLDDGGRLLHVSQARTDDEIVGALTPYVGGDCLVAIDGPLIVTNATGNRAAEALLNADFARFDAGAHPTNTSRPDLRDGPRGARLARRLGLVTDARSTGTRRAIEVYPHAAVVALFRRGRTLKYKSKPGRDFPQLHAELTLLLDLVESLGGAEPPLTLAGEGADPGGSQAWSALRTAAHDATRKSQLRFVEDQVDAVVCAYVGLFSTRRPELTTTYGDSDSGCIITPTLPPDLVPTPRGRRSLRRG